MTDVGTTPLDSEEVRALRRDTAGCGDRVHLDAAGSALPDRATVDAMVRHLRREAEVGGYTAEREAGDRLGAVPGALAALVGGAADEIATFDSSTRAWTTALACLDLGPGDRVVTARSEYGSNVLSLRLVAARRGVEVAVVDDRAGVVDADAVAAALDARTRLVALTHVPTGNGAIAPAEAVGAVTRAAGVPYLLDATQSVGQLPLDVHRLGCDLLTGTGRKFLRGPRGTGFLWVRRGLLEQLDPPAAVLGAVADDGSWVPGARRLEVHERSVASVIGLGVAAAQVRDLGSERIAARLAELATHLREGLVAVPGVRCADRGHRLSAIVTARPTGITATELAQRLEAHGVTVGVVRGPGTPLDPAAREPVVRFSPHVYVTHEDVERVLATLRALTRGSSRPTGPRMPAAGSSA